MQAMIFAAGLGTRLKPLTDTMPKALVPINGRPLLEILIEKMKAAGVTDIVVNVHHFADQIIRFLDEKNHFGLNIRISDEREMLLETGGGLKRAAHLFPHNEPILVHNVDILSNVDLRAFYGLGQSLSDNVDAVLLVSQRTTSRYLLFDAANRLVGWTNVQTGEVKSPYPNLCVADCQRFAFAGIHLFAPALFALMQPWPEKFSIIDFYLSVCDKIVIKGHPQTDLRLIDVGKLDTLAEAENFSRQE